MTPTIKTTSQQLVAECQELVRLSSAPEPDLQEISRRAQAHPLLARSLLKHANSTRFGLRTPVSDVDRAVSLLGAARVRSVVEQFLRDTVRLQQRTREMRR